MSLGQKCSVVKMLSFLDKLIANTELFIATCALIFLVGGVTSMVFFRYIFSSAPMGVEDICILAGVWLYFLGGAVATYKNTHIKGEVIPAIIKNKQFHKYNAVLVLILELIAAVWFSIVVFRYSSWIYHAHISTTAMRMPQVLLSSSLVAGGILMSFHILIQIIHKVKESINS